VPVCSPCFVSVSVVVKLCGESGREILLLPTTLEGGSSNRQWPSLPALDPAAKFSCSLDGVVQFALFGGASVLDPFSSEPRSTETRPLPLDGPGNLWQRVIHERPGPRRVGRDFSGAPELRQSYLVGGCVRRLLGLASRF